MNYLHSIRQCHLYIVKATLLYKLLGNHVDIQPLVYSALPTGNHDLITLFL